MKFYYSNLWDSQTLVESSESVNYPVENTQQRCSSRPWRSNYDANAGLFRVSSSNQKIYFNEGGGSITATLATGDYNAVTLATEIGNKMTAAGGGATYTATYNAGYYFTIAIDAGTFELEGATLTDAAWGMLGFDEVDTGLAASHDAEDIRIHTCEYIYSNMGAPTEFDAVFILNHNIQTSGTFIFEASNDNFATTDISVTLVMHGTKAAYHWDTSITYQYIRVWIEDIGNPAFYVQVGRVWLGLSFQPTISIEGKFKVDLDDTSTSITGETGNAMSIIRPTLKKRTYSFDIADPKASFDTMLATVGTSYPVIVLEKGLTPTSTWLNPEKNFTYLHFTDFSYSQVAGDYYSLKISTQEEV